MSPYVRINNAVAVIVDNLVYYTKIVCFTLQKIFDVILYIQYCASVSVINMYLYSSRKLLLIFSNLTLDAVMLTVLAEMTVALCPSFVSPIMKEQKIYNLYQ